MKQSFWIPLGILTLAGFTFNTSELIPIGLLSDIASSFGVSEARAGLLITVYAWVVALMSLPLMLLFAKLEFRRLMLGVVSVFFIS
ncbi:MAG: sugar transporter, partial [Duncaniella sp.]|nr:sugar transporter [Duncaniella sp.]